jgi:hypothetical protein
MKFHSTCIWIFGFNNGYVYLFFKVMCSWLFKIIMVHGIHHWNYLGFNVYLFNDIHVDLSIDMFSYRVKTPLNINGIAFEHQRYDILSW